MILFFDVETSDLADFKKRARDPSQPHIVKAHARFVDEAGATLEEYTAISKPDGWEITPENEKIHGISQAYALEHGIDEKEICAKLLEMMNRAKLVVAFNITFDKFLVRIGLRRFDLMTDNDDPAWKAMPTFCAMRPMTDICQLPFADGRKHYGKWWKFPTLEEAYKRAFGEDMSGAHDPVEDVKATVRLYFWLCNELNLPVGMSGKF